jgi:hypothetical protein
MYLGYIGEIYLRYYKCKDDGKRNIVFISETTVLLKFLPYAEGS